MNKLLFKFYVLNNNDEIHQNNNNKKKMNRTILTICLLASLKLGATRKILINFSFEYFLLKK